MEELVQVPVRILESILNMEDEDSELAIEIAAILEAHNAGGR